MTKRAKLASFAFSHYTSKARSAQVQCVLLVTVLLQILLCANDIEMNPGPSESETVTDMKAYMQDLFEHQEVRIQTLLQQLSVRFGVLENHLTEKIDESMTAVKTEIEALHAKTWWWLDLYSVDPPYSVVNVGTAANRTDDRQRTAVRPPTPADGHSRRKAVATEQETSLVQEPGNTTTATTSHVTPTAPGNTTTATSHAAPTTPGNTTTARTRCGATTIATTITTGTKPTPGRLPCTTSHPYKGIETPQVATTPTTCSVFPWLNNNSQLN